jgi:hypothetical protein
MQDICVTFIMKKRAGRPKVGIQNAKGVFFTARFTPIEAKQLEGAIQQAGLRKSVWMRKALLSAVASDKPAS